MARNVSQKPIRPNMNQTKQRAQYWRSSKERTCVLTIAGGPEDEERVCTLDVPKHGRVNVTARAHVDER